MVCPAPVRPLELPLTEWSGVYAQTDFDVNTDFFPQQDALSEEQRWTADGRGSSMTLWPVQAAEYPLAGSTVAGLEAALMRGTANEAVDSGITYGGDSSATYSAGDWAGWTADSACSNGAGSLYMCGAGGPAMSGDSSYMYGDDMCMNRHGMCMNRHGMCIYGHGTYMYGPGTYMDAAGSLDMFATNRTTETSIGSGPSPSRNTALESYNTAMAMSMATPANRSCYISSNPGADGFSHTMNSWVHCEPIPAESSSESSSFGQDMCAETHPQDPNAESVSMTDTFTRQESEGFMSSDELKLLLRNLNAI